MKRLGAGTIDPEETIIARRRLFLSAFICG